MVGSIDWDMDLYMETYTNPVTRSVDTKVPALVWWPSLTTDVSLTLTKINRELSSFIAHAKDLLRYPLVKEGVYKGEMI